MDRHPPAPILRTLQRILFGLLLLLNAVYFSRMAFVSEGLLEPGDGVTHYGIARHAPQNPELFFDHWGKPLFTLLVSPFAQLGYPGMIVFNVLLFCITCILLFAWAERRNNGLAWTIPLLLLSSIVYYDMVNAGMTEILFSTLLAATFYLFYREKYVWGAFLFSFSLFSRPEANVVLPVYLLFLLYKKQWKAVPFLGAGLLLYSIAGSFYYHDLFWFFTKNPYPAKVNFYGHGGPWHFIRHHGFIWGPVLAWGSLAGTAAVLVSLFTPGRRSRGVSYLLLVVLPLFGVVGVHSYIWWKGIHGSLGLLRVLATVMPLSVILGFLFVQDLQTCLARVVPDRVPAVFMWGTGFFLAWYLYTGNPRRHMLPLKQTPNQELLSEAAAWYRTENPSNRGMVSYSDPYFAMRAGINPYDTEKARMLYLLDKTDPVISLRPGDYIVWDAHFGPNDGQLSRERLVTNPRIRVLKTFMPADTIFAFGGQPYEIIVARVR